MLPITRNFLIYISAQLKSFSVNAVMSILIALTNFGFSVFKENASTQNLMYNFVLCIVVTVVALQFVRAVFFQLSGKIPLSIKINDNQGLETIIVKEGDTFVYGSIASLQIINQENFDLVNCYAVLRSAKYHSNGFDFLKMMSGSGEKRIQWKSEKDCQYTKIGAHGGEAILHIYKVAHKEHEGGSKTPDFSHFLLCGNNAKVTTMMLPYKQLIEIEIVVHAECDGRSLISRSFFGYVNVVIEKDFSGNLSIHKGKPPKK
jgi:hypothetical protein